MKIIESERQEQGNQMITTPKLSGIAGTKAVAAVMARQSATLRSRPSGFQDPGAFMGTDLSGSRQSSRDQFIPARLTFRRLERRGGDVSIDRLPPCRWHSRLRYYGGRAAMKTLDANGQEHFRPVSVLLLQLRLQ